METINEVSMLQEIQVQYIKNYPIVKVSSSQDAYAALKDIYLTHEYQQELKEYFVLLFLNRANNVIGFYKLSEGGLTGTVADLRIAFSVALKIIASSMILAHNHPSNNLSFSGADMQLTKKFKEAGELMDVKILDHIILGDNSYYSFADEGQL